MFAVLPSYRVHIEELDARADDLRVGNPCGQHSPDEIREGRDAIHPNLSITHSITSRSPKKEIQITHPPPKRFRGSEDTAKQEREREYQIANIPGCLCCFAPGDEHLTELLETQSRAEIRQNMLYRASKKHELRDEEEHECSPLLDLVKSDSVTIKADWVIPADEREKRRKQLPGNLDKDLRQEERHPRISFRGAFARLI